MNEVLHDELEVLTAIYDDEFDYDSNRNCLTFHLIQDQDAASSDRENRSTSLATAMFLLTVVIQVGPEYPNHPPVLSFGRTRGFGEEHLALYV